MSVIEINKKDFNSSIKEGKVVIDCYAEWCGPCRMLSPILEELSNELTNIKFYKLNIDNNEEIAIEYNVSAIPNLLIFEQGKLSNQLIGLRTKDELKELLK